MIKDNKIDKNYLNSIFFKKNGVNIFYDYMNMPKIFKYNHVDIEHLNNSVFEKNISILNLKTSKPFFHPVFYGVKKSNIENIEEKILSFLISPVMKNEESFFVKLLAFTRLTSFGIFIKLDNFDSLYPIQKELANWLKEKEFMPSKEEMTEYWSKKYTLTKGIY